MIILTFILLLQLCFSCQYPLSFNLPYGGYKLYQCPTNDWEGIQVNTNVNGTILSKISTYSVNSRGSFDDYIFGIIPQSIDLITDNTINITVKFSLKSSRYNRGKDEQYYLEYECKSPLCQVSIDAYENSVSNKLKGGFLFFITFLILLIQ